ncbi:MAG: YbaN family protein [Elusimicrobiales bacterium]|nr:YbaN family protein [Elusimicrobiales bacterium]
METAYAPRPNRSPATCAAARTASSVLRARRTSPPDRPAKGRRPARALLAALGVFFVALGALGAALPVLPTTPFLLLAAWCFARSSDSLHRRLHENRFFGEYLRRYNSGEGLPLRAKAVTISLLWLTLGASAAWAWPERPWLTALLIAIGAAVTAHILLIGRKKGR